MKSISLEPWVRLEDDGAGKIVAFGAGADGLPYILKATEPLDYRSKDGCSLVIRPKKPQSYKIYRVEPGRVGLAATIVNEPYNIHDIQPVGEGQFLLVCARCHYYEKYPEQNGRLYTSDGKLVRRLTLGDGIQDVQVAPDGLIWTSYFDEGVFGNYGWSHPLGASGLVAWSQEGTKVFEFEPGDLEQIIDCYALNVSGNDVWIYYYTGFPLVQIRDRQIVAAWALPIAGTDAFAVDDSYALFRGGYDGQDRYELLELTKDGAACVSQIEFRDPKGEVITAQRAVGRGDSIFLLRGNEVFAVSVLEAFVQ